MIFQSEAGVKSFRSALTLDHRGTCAGVPHTRAFMAIHGDTLVDQDPSDFITRAYSI